MHVQCSNFQSLKLLNKLILCSEVGGVVLCVAKVTKTMEDTDSANEDREDGRGNEKVEFDPELFQLTAAAQEWKGTNRKSVGELLQGLLK